MRIILLENFRAVFYTPFYAAFALGAYEEEGVDVALEASPDPSRTANLLMFGTAHVSWGGPMRVMVAHDQNPACDLKIFCEVVCRDPFFLVARTPNSEFQVGDLMGRRIAAVSEVPTPWMCLQHDLRLAGLHPKDVDRAPERTMGENAEALRSGDVDVIQTFQPFVEEMVQEGAGHIWYAAASRGLTTYTAFYATAVFLREHPESALGMTRAMRKTGRWLAECDSEEVARCVKPYFEDVPFRLLSQSIARYQKMGIWNQDPRLTRESFAWLRAACLSGGLIKTGVSYDRAVNMRFVDATVS